MTLLRLQELATQRGMDLRRIHQYSGLPLDLLRSYWNNDTLEISLQALSLLARVLNVNPSELIGNQSSPSPFSAERASPAAAVEHLAVYEIPADQRAQLADYLTTAPDHELYRINANYLASRLNWPVRTLLGVLAAAVQTGIMELHWEYYCLDCGHEQDSFAALAQARREQTCQNCHIHAPAPFDSEIIVTFTIHAALRAISIHADDRSWKRAINTAHGRVTGHDILTIQGFRDFFLQEPLPINESFHITHMALMFTDLGESTALYAQQGDPRAFSLVREHYHHLFASVGAAGGAVIKTIGDAVMAAFPRGGMALAAALDAQRTITRLNKEFQLGDDESLKLKIGLHAGPALMVTLDNRLDYFGTTVNVAARLQRLATAGEIVFSTALHTADQAETIQDAYAACRESVVLRGTGAQAFTIYRLPQGSSRQR
jgi:class 3 adenylate cyclase/transcriptional regulator with XRE-family HTH domain